MKRRVCIVTGTRAEYGLLRHIMVGIRDDDAMELQTIVTGAHLSPEFGLTYREILQDGFSIDRRVEMLLSSDTPSGIAKSMGLGMVGFGDALDNLKPDVLVVLGDRFEIFSAVAAALVARIPVAHIHGGEITEGAFDDALRHSITKMSHLHFVAAERYRQRVLQLGEDPANVFLVGGLGVDVISRTDLMDRRELEGSMGFTFGDRNLLITFHPATLDDGPAVDQMSELLAALHEQEGVRLIFTLPNADTGGRILAKMIRDFVERHPNAVSYESLGERRYLSCIAQVDGVVGNSSSGLLEAPALGVGTINIGDRQRGRLVASSVISCAPRKADITAALVRLYSEEFRSKLADIVNPYGDEGAIGKILYHLKHCELAGLVRKKFFDIPFPLCNV